MAKRDLNDQNLNFEPHHIDAIQNGEAEHYEEEVDWLMLTTS